MEDARRKNVDLWESIYRGGHKLNYPDDALVRTVHRTLSVERHPKVLDFGFGSGEAAIHLAKRGHAVSGVEVSEAAWRTAQSRFREAGLEADLRLIRDDRLPFADATFDAVVAWQVLYYNTWATLKRSVGEIERVLRPGGMAIFTMQAPGHIQHASATDLGDGLYASNITSQEGAIFLVPRREDLPRCFPGRDLKVGSFSYAFEAIETRYWIVCYEIPVA
jgi:SAM-dependent methyltransferase